MSAPPYMKLYIADYLADTTHLTRGEHGAYLLLLMALWRAGGKLPRDPGKLSRIAKCSPAEWDEIGPVVMGFFKVSGGSLSQKRATKEIAKYRGVVSGSKTAGKASAAKRANKNSEQAPTDVEKPFNGNPTNHNHNHNQKEEEVEGAQVLAFSPAEAPLGGQAATRSKGSRIKADWKPSADNIAYAAAEGFTEPETQRIAETFRDYWTSAAGKGATKLDWSAAWRNWVRSERDRRPSAARSATKRADWI